MATNLTRLQLAVHQVFERFKRPLVAEQGTERKILMDDANGHYQVLNVGWNGFKRTFAVVVHLDVTEDLIWIQVDNTEPSIAESLLELGIGKQEIVLAFHAPYKRPDTGYATGT